MRLFLILALLLTPLRGLQAMPVVDADDNSNMHSMSHDMQAMADMDEDQHNCDQCCDVSCCDQGCSCTHATPALSIVNRIPMVYRSDSMSVVAMIYSIQRTVLPLLQPPISFFR